jgi:hypothetical protein
MDRLASDIVIDPEFAKLIPPLMDEELSQLERNIVNDGEIRDPLVVWGQGDKGRPIVLAPHD